jgi:peptidoglycan-associated lipoprotein
MKPRLSLMLSATVLALGLVAVGCAKRAPAPATPPPPTPTPTETPSTPPTPPPPATTPAPTPPSIGASDFQPVFFDYDSHSLREDGREALDRNARVMRDNPGLMITIEGHCDERGTVEYNQALGERRAQAARDYLVAAGIAGTRLTVISYGKERPFATGSDETAWAQNRRAHFTLR